MQRLVQGQQKAFLYRFVHGPGYVDKFRPARLVVAVYVLGNVGGQAVVRQAEFVPRHMHSHRRQTPVLRMGPVAGADLCGTDVEWELAYADNVERGQMPVVFNVVAAEKLAFDVDCDGFTERGFDVQPRKRGVEGGVRVQTPNTTVLRVHAWHEIVGGLGHYAHDKRAAGIVGASASVHLQHDGEQVEQAPHGSCHLVQPRGNWVVCGNQFVVCYVHGCVAQRQHLVGRPQLCIENPCPPRVGHFVQ